MFGGFGGACSNCRDGHRTTESSTQLFATLSLPEQCEATIFSRDPSVLQFVITGCVDFIFVLVKYGEYINRDSIKVQSYGASPCERWATENLAEGNIGREVHMLGDCSVSLRIRKIARDDLRASTPQIVVGMMCVVKNR